MSIEFYLEKMKDIQKKTIIYLENDSDSDLFEILNDYKIKESKHELGSFLHLLSKLSNNFHRVPLIYSKIEKILHFFITEIKAQFSSNEIFNIFNKNKKILLFLIKNKMITIDKFISDRMKNDNYEIYFYPELKPFLTFSNDEDEQEILEQITDDFDLKREIGENDSYICKLIRNDSIEDFIVYVNKANIPLSDMYIKQSIFETNPILLASDEISLIEYAAFFGAIQIIHYLKTNGIELNSSLWIFAIHSNNSEIINFLEENNIEPDDNSYTNILYESIKCHHNDIVMYIHSNYSDHLEKYSISTFEKILQYYNFEFMKPDKINKYSFKYLCKYDYYILVKSLIENENIDINQIIKIF